VITMGRPSAISACLWRLSRRTKLPKPEILIFSPRPSVSFIISKGDGRRESADSFFENPPSLL